jgi:hypothetical protein
MASHLGPGGGHRKAEYVNMRHPCQGKIGRKRKKVANPVPRPPRPRHRLRGPALWSAAFFAWHGDRRYSGTRLTIRGRLVRGGRIPSGGVSSSACRCLDVASTRAASSARSRRSSWRSTACCLSCVSRSGRNRTAHASSSVNAAAHGFFRLLLVDAALLRRGAPPNPGQQPYLPHLLPFAEFGVEGLEGV